MKNIKLTDDEFFEVLDALEKRIVLMTGDWRFAIQERRKRLEELHAKLTDIYEDREPSK